MQLAEKFSGSTLLQTKLQCRSDRVRAYASEKSRGLQLLVVNKTEQALSIVASLPKVHNKRPTETWRLKRPCDGPEKWRHIDKAFTLAGAWNHIRSSAPQRHTVVDAVIDAERTMSKRGYSRRRFLRDAAIAGTFLTQRRAWSAKRAASTAEPKPSDYRIFFEQPATAVARCDSRWQRTARCNGLRCAGPRAHPVERRERLDGRTPRPQQSAGRPTLRRSGSFSSMARCMRLKRWLRRR